MLSAQPVLAQRQCSSLSDQSAFEVQALRSELMVLATGCHDDDEYNAFIRRFQADLQSNERAINAYFQHRYGRAAQTEHDRFVTDLANAISRQGTALGGDFCPRNGMIFHEVLALQSSTELADFAAGKDLVPATYRNLHADGVRQRRGSEGGGKEEVAGVGRVALSRLAISA